MNWNRIGANFAATFFTVLAAVNFAGLTGGRDYLAALIGAAIQGGLSAAQEWKAECDDKVTPPPKSGKKSVRPLLTLF